MWSVRRLAALALGVALACLGCGSGRTSPTLQDGVLDLSSWRFETDGTVVITGDWWICWGELLAPDVEACPGGGWDRFPAPRLWSDSGAASPIGGRGVATYRATLRLPADAPGLTLRVGAPLTAHRLWIDGEDRGGSGTVGPSPATTVAKLENRFHALPRDVPEIELRVQVANFAFRGGGLRREWVLGTNEQAHARAGYELLLYAGFATGCGVIGLVFLAQFGLRPSERARGWFGLFSLLVGLRILPGSTGDLYQLTMGWASFESLLRLEYMNTALLVAVGLAYLRDKIPGVMPLRLTQLPAVAALLLVPIHAFAPLDAVLVTLPILLVLPPYVVVLAVTSYGRAARRRLPGATGTLVVGLAFAIGIIHDVVRTQTGVGGPIELFPYFVVVFLASEAHSLLQAFARSHARAETLSAELEEANFELQETEQAVARFVPFDLLQTLGKGSIRQVDAGDHVTASMAVLCCGLPSSSLGAGPNPLAPVHALLEVVEPVVRAHQGFVVPPAAGAIVALFPSGPADALAAARELRSWRACEASGVAVTSGKVSVGTVGDDASLATVALGEPIELARALAAAARERGELVVSESVCRALGLDATAGLREAATLRLPGAAEASPFYAVVETQA